MSWKSTEKKFKTPRTIDIFGKIHSPKPQSNLQS